MSKIRTSIGEVGLTFAEREVVLRPSLYAMSKLGNPTEIVEVFANLFAPNARPRDVFHAALDVIQACTDEDISDFTGHMGSRYGTWVAGHIPYPDLLPLARSLARHGIVGVVPEIRRPQQDGDYKAEFDPREFVSQAIAHLGLSEEAAWDMTTTSFILAMRAKYPPEQSNAPSKQDLEKVEDFMSSIGR